MKIEKMKPQSLQIITLMFLTGLMISCANEYEFAGAVEGFSGGAGESTFHEFYIYEPQQALFRQNTYDYNQISISFQINTLNGEATTPLDTLEASDLIVTENGQRVTNFRVSKINETPQPVDIVFVIDETRSMTSKIEAVKKNVGLFVEQLIDVNFIGNLCLVTFNDRVQERCLNFIEDDPLTPDNENVSAFLTRLQAVELSHGFDYPENQLAGLISAAEETPWHQKAQRVAILITDAEFNSTTSPGDAGSYARSYTDTLDAIEDSQMTVFIAGPEKPGYFSEFNGEPSIPDASNGLFFNISEVIEDNGQGLANVLSEVTSSISSLYVAEYKVEDNNLDPSLDISERIHTIAFVDPDNKQELTIQSAISTMPSGAPEYKTKWKLQISPTDTLRSLVVTIGNEIIEEIEYQVEDGFLVFNDPPEGGSDIRVQYEFTNMRDNMPYITPLISELPEYESFDVIVYYNDIIPEVGDYQMNTIGDQFFLEPTENTFSNEDPYGIRKNGGLEVNFKFVQKTFEIER